ncbi:hypothetical protein ACNHYB_08100 [Isoptericola jiangsuensis]|uniref:hypothetical protein n=1 Tax=Isoptericola jiangsuensis TaxID=548579 RepID=UPI003AAFC35B
MERMGGVQLMKRGLIITGLVAVSMLAVGGCGASESSEPATDGAPSATTESSDGTLTVGTAPTIDGASPFSTDGVTVQVPEGWVTDRTEESGIVQVLVYDPADQLNPVAITVSSEASDEAVNVQSDVTWTQLGSAGVSELARHTVEWPAWAYATGITGVVERDGGETSTFVSVSARDQAETVMVSVSAQTGEDDLEQSLQYQVLQTVEPAS